jgi:hypothetical protein
MDVKAVRSAWQDKRKKKQRVRGKNKIFEPLMNTDKSGCFIRAAGAGISVNQC